MKRLHFIFVSAIVTTFALTASTPIFGEITKQEGKMGADKLHQEVTAVDKAAKQHPVVSQHIIARDVQYTEEHPKEGVLGNVAIAYDAAIQPQQTKRLAEAEWKNHSDNNVKNQNDDINKKAEFKHELVVTGEEAKQYPNISKKAAKEDAKYAEQHPIKNVHGLFEAASQPHRTAYEAEQAAHHPQNAKDEFQNMKNSH